MREGCIECVMKHISQAIILYHEMFKGYPEHLVYVVGHLAEAEDEILEFSKELCLRIRRQRKLIQLGEKPEELEELLFKIYELYQKNKREKYEKA
jgi:hypothetical protein